MFEKEESLNLNDNFPLTQLPIDLLSPILSHLGIKDLILQISLVNKNWQAVAEKLIKVKIDVKKEELARRFLANHNKSVEKIDNFTKTLILEAAKNQYLPLLWEKPLASDNVSTSLKKKEFNIALREDVISILGAHHGFPFALEEKQESRLLAQNLQYADFSFFEMKCLPFDSNLRGINFTGSRLEYPNFTNKDLTAANFSNTKLEWIAFNGTILRNTNFSNAKFNSGDLRGATITGANFSDVKFSQTLLYNLSFKDINLTNTDFTESKGLEAENLIYASHLRGIKLPYEFDFTFMNLSELNLSKSIMNCVKLDKAYLAKSNLTEATLSSASASSTDFNGANLSGANLIYSNIYNSNLSYCNLSGANFQHARVEKSNFYEADLTNAKFDYVDFSKTNIRAEQLLSAGSIVEIKIEKSHFMLNVNYLCRFATIIFAGFQ
ncbi:MAG: pentapeptide repeat-containing protein [Nitrosopumilus sp.]|nr:pentapeptide repeat-containing protein [Nitrosopumilus sp.]